MLTHKSLVLTELGELTCRLTGENSDEDFKCENFLSIFSSFYSGLLSGVSCDLIKQANVVGKQII